MRWWWGPGGGRLWRALLTPPAGAGAALLAVLLLAACSSVGPTSVSPGKGAVTSAVATLAPAPEPFRGGPRLYISEQLLDFGSVDLGTRVVATFHLRNTGSAPLKIESAFARVVMGCCPPTPALAKTVLRPGEASTLSMDFTMSEGMGELHLFEVVIQSNDAVQNEQVVRVQADFK